jgi:hypothetical protein
MKKRLVVLLVWVFFLIVPSFSSAEEEWTVVIVHSDGYKQPAADRWPTIGEFEKIFFGDSFPTVKGWLNEVFDGTKVFDFSLLEITSRLNPKGDMVALMNDAIIEAVAKNPKILKNRKIALIFEQETVWGVINAGAPGYKLKINSNIVSFQMVVMSCWTFYGTYDDVKCNLGMVVHEIGHAYGMRHPYYNGRPYLNPWSPMGDPRGFQDLTKLGLLTSLSGHFLAFEELCLGIISQNEVATIRPGEEKEIELDLLSLPGTGDRTRMVLVPIDRSKTLSIEARGSGGGEYDLIPLDKEGIVMNQINDMRVWGISLDMPGNNSLQGGLSPGEVYTTNGVEILVLSKTETGYFVKVKNSNSVSGGLPIAPAITVFDFLGDDIRIAWNLDPAVDSYVIDCVNNNNPEEKFSLEMGFNAQFVGTPAKGSFSISVRARNSFGEVSSPWCSFEMK